MSRGEPQGRGKRSPDRKAIEVSIQAALAALAMGLAGPAAAQLTTSPGQQIERLPAQPLPEPVFEPDAPAEPLRLPPVEPTPAEQDRLSSGLRVFVREFRITGSTVFTPEELAEVAAPYRNREITTEELEELRQKLTRYYVERGYISSGAVIPDQKVADGVVRIAIVEGRLAEILVEGTSSLKPEYVSERLALGADPPLDVNRLQERIQLLLQTPFLERVNADLAPGDRPGEARLRARVEETTPYDVSITLDNHLSPSQGEVQGVAAATLRNLTGHGDTLHAEAAFAEGVNDFFIEYAHPLNARDTTLSFNAERSRAEVVEEPFDLIDIESEFWAAGVRLSHPVYRTPRSQLVLSGGLDRRHSRTTLLGLGFPFSPGVDNDGESDVTVLRFGQEWLDRTRTQVVAARSTFSLGVNALGSTQNSVGPDGEFFAWLLQFQLARRLGDSGIEAIFRTEAQLTHHQLLPLEQFAVGGASSVRGYRENQLVRDWGYGGSLEFRIPVTFFQSEGERTTLRIAPFIDFGGAWNNDRPTPEPRTIAAPGVGLRWDPHPRVHAELYWAHPLVDVVNASDTLQDDGLHFQLRLDLFD